MACAYKQPACRIGLIVGKFDLFTCVDTYILKYFVFNNSKVLCNIFSLARILILPALNLKSISLVQID